MKRNIPLIVLSVTLIISLFFNIFSLFSTEEKSITNYESLWKILSCPDMYNKQILSVEGVLCVNDNGVALYLSKEHMEHNVKKNALYIDFEFPEAEYADLLALNGKYVDIKGKLNLTNYGPNEDYSGVIECIEKCKPNGEPWGPGVENDDGSIVIN